MIENADIFNLEKPQPAPMQGGLILSEPFLADMHFHQACICLVKYGCDKRPLGLVLNKELTISLNDIVAEIKTDRSIPLFCGGPVAVDHLLFIHDLGFSIPNAEQICDNLYFNGDFQSIIEYINAGNPVDGHVKFFLGYSGWEMEQMEEELGNHVWAVCNNAPRESYLNSNVDGYWRECVRLLGNDYRNWLLCPEMPILN